MNLHIEDDAIFKIVDGSQVIINQHLSEEWQCLIMIRTANIQDYHHFVLWTIDFLFVCGHFLVSLSSIYGFLLLYSYPQIS